MNGKKAALLVGALLCPGVLLLAVIILFVAAVAGGAADHEDDTGADAAGWATPAQVDGINPVMLDAYGKAAQSVTQLRPQCKGMRWSIVAGIGKIESNHAAGRHIAADGAITPHILGPRLDGSGVGGNTSAISDTDGGRLDGDPQFDRAVGPMQFLPGTWNGSSGQDGNGDGVKDPHNAFDAALGTAVYLCGTGAADLSKQDQLDKAILRYNHSQTYVNDVTGWIRTYDQTGASSSDTAVGGRAGAVIEAARAQLGGKYVWGGGDINGPTKGGFDCSGLMLYAFHHGAGITLPRTSQTQRTVGTKVSNRSQLQPGDLIVFNNDGAWGHVGLYVGGGQMIDAPNPSKPIEQVAVTTGYWTQFDWDIRRVL
ncbi:MULTISPECIES: C40 family peptidase [unclassified Streptomyces]|uniref:C40 family peptidase n=1 Tax=unclassified Streptomyces TaxID=2593676 RepID=UPI002E2137E5|nr:bifunctional lytic transglycosylase/C40 family peptidase [Streptomyces sp. NBC_00963]